MVRGSQSYYDRIRAMTEIGHTTLDFVFNIMFFAKVLNILAGSYE